MKINQFAIIDTDHEQIIKELKTIRFLSPRALKIADPVMLWRNFLLKFYIEHQGRATRIEKVKGLMATDTQDAYEYTTKHRSVSKQAFYNVALQLLGFEVDEDFHLNAPIAAFNEMGLPVAQVGDELSADDLIDAWYLLLNTRTKNGQSLIDYLASQGYYAQYFTDNVLPQPLFFNGKAQAVFDTRQLIHDVVYVESDLDSDRDGKRDLLKVEVLRPAETEPDLDNSITVPVIYTASPYNQGTNDTAGEQMMHRVNRSLTPKPASKITKEAITTSFTLPTPPKPREATGTTSTAEETFAHTSSYTLNDYFLARGFAVVYAAGIGTKGSDGIRTTGSELETLSTTAIIEWLTGDRPAYTNKVDDIQIDAFWSNHNVAMTGRSYLGTLATAAATTGVKGLKTAIVEAGISNWYDYYRENGLVIAPLGFQGEDTDVLAEETFSRQKVAGNYRKVKGVWEDQLEQITDGQDRRTGNYNTFWDHRNYLKNVKNVKADMFIVHGLNDWNVKTSHAFNLWNALKDTKVTQKLILHQGKHIYINNFRSLDFNEMMNLWLSNKLYEINNGANEVLPDTLVQDNVSPDTWTEENDWGGDPEIHHTHLNDGTWGQAAIDVESYSDHLSKTDFELYSNDIKQWEKDMMANESPLENNRIRLLTQQITQAHYLDGQPSVDLKISSNAEVGMVSVALVDYAEAKRLTEDPVVLKANGIDTGFRWRFDDLKEFQLDSHITPYKVISIGHMNLQNRTNAYQNDELKPNKFYSVHLNLQPSFYHLPAGHRLGLVIFGTDMATSIRGNQDIEYKVDLTKSQLNLPFKKHV
ncbi:Xaa-Pro dipeptidyl-peptidase [Lentilactobacillus senioris]|uniref:Xaa-Pro dipeptidyl-peptidase n=1 Tax=Lentilactobacillus senioris TaxID=931534 RepID=UPI003D2C647A